MTFMKPIVPSLLFLYAMTITSCGNKKQELAAEVPEENVV
jgi:hypothetical protein